MSEASINSGDFRTRFQHGYSIPGFSKLKPSFYIQPHLCIELHLMVWLEKLGHEINESLLKNLTFFHHFARSPRSSSFLHETASRQNLRVSFNTVSLSTGSLNMLWIVSISILRNTMVEAGPMDLDGSNGSTTDCLHDGYITEIFRAWGNNHKEIINIANAPYNAIMPHDPEYQLSQ